MYGILKNSTNTGSADELASVFAAPLSITSNQPEFSSDTMSLLRVVSFQGVQRWEVEAEIMPVSTTPEHLIQSVLLGGHSSAYVRMPQTVHQEFSVECSVMDNAVANSGKINVVGISPTRGSFIRFANHNKVYIVVDSTEIAGGFELSVYPTLRKAVPANTIVQYGKRVTARMKFDTSSIRGIKYQDGILASPGTIKLIEDLK